MCHNRFWKSCCHRRIRKSLAERPRGGKPINLVIAAFSPVASAISASGSNVDLCAITTEGTTMLRNYVTPTSGCQRERYRLRLGTTA
ncbi:hypothetical protein BS47DRAFT_216472 [Hydnum rufescens UP504]|uniref:Uncharacterized protein n=1 Tax=Hydnum rufescens UP504 TaxID=1448309 RepID=A0A9P6AMQ8_9AGAM|nr:hypothetical protein BS47DRAFT_216472 [Hydnum rufescens UP504]